jgi:uncharacterized protein
MRGFAARIANLWIGRKQTRGTASDLSAARAAVAEKQPAAVITGGSRGIGAALAHVFAANGHRVMIVARDAQTLEKTATQIKSLTGQTVAVLACDVTEPNVVEQIEAALDQAGLYLDILVNNAAIGLSGPFENQSPADLDHLIALNITAVTQLTHHALPAMRARGRGGILNVASLGAYSPGPNQAMYYASKAFVVSLSEAIANECAGYGVRIAAIVPGPADTDFHANMGAGGARYRQLLPSLSAERVAKAGYRGFILGQKIIAPGLLTRPAMLALRLLPHAITVPLVSWLLARPHQ